MWTGCPRIELSPWYLTCAVSFPTTPSSLLLLYQPAVHDSVHFWCSPLGVSPDDTEWRHRPTRHHLTVRFPASSPSILPVWRFLRPPLRLQNLQIGHTALHLLFIGKDTNGQPDEKAYRARSGRVLRSFSSVSMVSGAPPSQNVSVFTNLECSCSKFFIAVLLLVKLLAVGDWTPSQIPLSLPCSQKSGGLVWGGKWKFWLYRGWYFCCQTGPSLSHSESHSESFP